MSSSAICGSKLLLSIIETRKWNPQMAYTHSKTRITETILNKGSNQRTMRSWECEETSFKPRENKIHDNNATGA